MSDFFASGHAVDLVLAVMALEAIVLIVRKRSNSLGIALAILPGAMILLGVRAALIGAAWQWVALALAAAFPFHIADIRRRGL